MTMDALRAQLETLPAGAFKSFHDWVFQDTAPGTLGPWLKANGWLQLERLAGHLFSGLVEERELGTVLARLEPLHAYAVYVTAADVLEDVPRHHPLEPRAREVIHGFNAAMGLALQGEHARGVARLHALAEVCATLPAFTWRLFPSEHLELARRWATGGLEALERESVLMSLWMQLLAAERLVGQARGTPLAPLVEEGVRARYQAVDTLLGAPPEEPSALLEAATWSVLVSPSLAVYLLALRHLRPELRLEAEAWRAPLYDAAVQVRLLNDYGPLILLEEERLPLLDRALAEAPPGTLGETLRTGLPAWAGLLTRVRRDLGLGESSLAHQGLEERPVGQAREPFMQRLRFFGRAWRQAARRMNETLDALAAASGQPEPGTLVRRFVGFHAALYARTADRGQGDYRVE